MISPRARVAALLVTLVLLSIGVWVVASIPTVVLTTMLAMAISGAASGLLVWVAVSYRLDRISDDLERSAGGATAANAANAANPPLVRNSFQRLESAAGSATASIQNVTTAATTDPLTGVANRSALMGQLAYELERSKRHARPLSVAFIDIDRFKAVNDTHGHEAGDAVLRGVAHLIQESIRTIDTFGRYGGEEFLLLLPESDPSTAAETAERLRQVVMRARFPVANGGQLTVTVSIGVAGGRGRDLEIEQLIRDADTAMYSAKTLGRNQVYVFEVPTEDGVVLRTPIDPASRALGRTLGRRAREAAEASLLETLHSLGIAAQPGPFVQTVARDMGMELGMGDAELEAMRIAALFHDAGMIGVPDEIIDRPRPLDQAGWQQVTQHPRLSSLMLEEASRLHDASEIVLHHHERFAGHGYPHGLRGPEIPLGSRVLAVADAYDAMRQDRPHRRALSHQEALAEIQRHAGTQFDPTVATAFLRRYADAPPTTTEIEAPGAPAAAPPGPTLNPRPWTPAPREVPRAG